MCTHYRKLENMYHAAPVNRLYQPILKVSEGHSTLLMEVAPDFFHAANALHGSVCFKALDDAAFFAVNSMVEDFFVVTVSFNLYLLRPVTEGTLRAEGTVTSSSKSLHFADAVLYVGNDELVARGNGTFMRSKIRLDQVESYR